MSIFSDYYLISSSGDSFGTDSEDEKDRFIEFHRFAGRDVAVYQLNEDESVGIE